jgi:hypothetical protein
MHLLVNKHQSYGQPQSDNDFQPSAQQPRRVLKWDSNPYRRESARFESYGQLLGKLDSMLLETGPTESNPMEDMNDKRKDSGVDFTSEYVEESIFNAYWDITVESPLALPESPLALVSKMPEIEISVTSPMKNIAPEEANNSCPQIKLKLHLMDLDLHLRIAIGRNGYNFKRTKNTIERKAFKLLKRTFSLSDYDLFHVNAELHVKLKTEHDWEACIQSMGASPLIIEVVRVEKPQLFLPELSDDISTSFFEETLCLFCV